jgi:hypothetical protein
MHTNTNLMHAGKRVAEDNPLPVQLRATAGEEPTPRLTATYAKPASATQYAIGDIIADNATAASVTPITFTLPRVSGIVTSCRAVLTAASGTVVLPAFDLLLFRPATGIPFAASLIYQLS